MGGTSDPELPIDRLDEEAGETGEDDAPASDFDEVVELDNKVHPVEISLIVEISDLSQASDIAKISDEPPTDIGRARRQAPITVAPTRPNDDHSSGVIRLVDSGLIAKGGMATIHKVFDRNIRRHVALKRVDAELGASTPDANQLLVEEAQITGQLDHPNIVPIYDLGIAADSHPQFTMKLVQGETLTRLIRASGPPGRASPPFLRKILEVFLKVCDAVSFAHSRGVIHRDLKPDNVMIGSHGQVYVMDWGCALLIGAPASDEAPVTTKAAASRRAVSGTVLGTAAYMAPEQAKGGIEMIDARTDVYSLGAILYHVLTQKPPHRGKTYVESVLLAQIGDVTPPHKLLPNVDLPEGLAAIAMKAMSPLPGDRYRSVAELRTAVDGFLASVGRFAEKRFQAGDVIMREGEQGDSAYILLRGTCEVSRMINGVNTPLRRMGPGEVFGETAIITSQTRSASVVALDDVVTTVIHREALERELGMDSWIGSFVRALAARFREAEKRIDRNAQSSVFDRVVEAVRVHLLAAGETAEDGSMEAPWARLRAALAHTLDLPGEIIAQSVLGSAELKIDEARDVIIWRTGAGDPAATRPLGPAR